MDTAANQEGRGKLLETSYVGSTPGTQLCQQNHMSHIHTQYSTSFQHKYPNTLLHHCSSNNIWLKAADPQ